MERARTIDQFYEAAANPSLWPQALDRLARLSGARGCILVTPGVMPGELPCSPAMDEPTARYFAEDWHLRDHRTEMTQSLPDFSGVVTDQDLFTPETMVKSEFYRDFALPMDVPWFAGARLTGVSGREFIAFALQRAAREGHFTPGEVARLAAMLPQLRNAGAMALHLARIRSASMIEGLTLSGQAAILLGRSGQVLDLTPAAEARLGNGLFIRQMRLRATQPSDDSSLTGLISLACDQPDAFLEHASPGPLSIGGQKLRLMPVRRSAEDIFGQIGALVLLSTRKTQRRLAPEFLRLRLGLTPREAEIMQHMGEGARPATIAERLGISPATVRFHLKILYSKTGIHRQSDLVTLYLQLAQDHDEANPPPPEAPI